MSEPNTILKGLFFSHFNELPSNIEALAQSGSYRQYFRLQNKNHCILGVYNTDLDENEAYLSFTNTFANADIKVPKVSLISEDRKSYLIEDLGSTSLWDLAQKEKKENGELSEVGISTYKKTLSELINIQTKTIEKLDLSYCYPRDAFDKQSILWDLNYFKYFFLRLLRVSVNEQELENDIQALSEELNKVDQNFFLYRDFQSRNVMIKENIPYFIDFQGGRKGAFYYDLASLLYDANVELKENDRNTLSDYYYKKINEVVKVNKVDFENNYKLFATVRLAQALGAFGLRGVIEKKPNFKECIPFALKALKGITKDEKFTKQYPTLKQCILDANDSEYINKVVHNEEE